MWTDFPKAVSSPALNEATAQQRFFACCTQRKHSKTCLLYQPSHNTGRSPIALNPIADCLIEISQTDCFLPSSWRLRVRKNDATKKNVQRFSIWKSFTSACSIDTQMTQQIADTFINHNLLDTIIYSPFVRQQTSDCSLEHNFVSQQKYNQSKEKNYLK